MRLEDYLLEEDREALNNLISSARKILERPVDLAYTDHTIEHKKIVHNHLNTFLGPWFAEQDRKHGRNLIRQEILVLLSAAYIHDIGMQLVRPQVLAKLPSLTDAERQEAAELPGDSITEHHRRFARRHHHKITHDWIINSNGAIPELPPLMGLDDRRIMVARVARAHNIWLTDKESYEEYRDAVKRVHEPVGEIRIDLLAAFLRLADILDQDKRRVDMAAARRLVMPPVSKLHWWRHHYVNACRITGNTDHSFPLMVAFRLPERHRTEQAWLLPALYSATVNEIEAEVKRLGPWLGESGIHIVIPEIERCGFEYDPDADPMPPDVLEAFRKTWRRAEGEASRAHIHNAVEQGQLTANLMVKALPGLSAGLEIEDYVGNVQRQLDGEFRDNPYSPLELKIENQPELRSALDQLERQLHAPQAKPHPIVLVGAPGGGKTMLLRRYVWEWSGRSRGEIPLPVYIQSTRFGDPEWAESVERRLGTQENPCSDQTFNQIVGEAASRFQELLATTLCEMAGLRLQHEAQMKNVLTDLLARTPVVVLFDGINELPPMLRKLGAWAIQDFIRRYRAHRAVVTSRTGDFMPADFPDRLYCELQPMTEMAVRAYWADTGVSTVAIQRFFARTTPGTLELVQIPMAAFMTGELLKNHPDASAISNHGRLYQSYARKTLDQWQDRSPAARLSAEQAHMLLSEIAYRAFESQQVSFSIKLAERTVADWLQPLEESEATSQPTRAPSDDTASKHIVQELLSTGLLVQVGASERPDLRFRHHTLQDYFAATAIVSRWDQLPAIVAQPVFHEAIGMLAGVVDDPILFLERLASATSSDWGYVQLLPLLFRVIGVTTVPIPRPVLLRIFAAALPIYSAAVCFLIPFAAEVLCHLFAQVGWPVLGQFLAFIANSPERPEWERELARKDVITVLNQQGQPTEDALLPIFASRIPVELMLDHRSAKATLEAMIDEDYQVGSFNRESLVLSGITGSLSLSLEEKIRAIRALSKLSENKLQRLQGVFLSEVSEWGSFIYEWINEIGLIHDLMVNSCGEILLMSEDSMYASGNRSFAQAYLAAYGRLNCKAPLIIRLITVASEISIENQRIILDIIRKFEMPNGLILSRSAWKNRADITISSEVASEIDLICRKSKNPFLVNFLYNLSGQTMPKSEHKRLENMVVKNGSFGYLLAISQWNWEVPRSLSRYRFNENRENIQSSIDNLLAGDKENILQLIIERGLTSRSISAIVMAAGKDFDRLIAVAMAISSIDNDVGTHAKMEVLNNASRNFTGDKLEEMWEIFNVDKNSSIDLMRINPNLRSNDLIKFISSKFKIKRDFTKIDILYLKSEILNDRNYSAIKEGIEMISWRHQWIYDAYYNESIDIIIKECENIKSNKNVKSFINDLISAMLSHLKMGRGVDKFISTFDNLVKIGDIKATDISEKISLMLKDSSIRLQRRDGRKLSGLLMRIDEIAIADCLDAYLDLCPPTGPAAGGHLGSGAWCCYRAGSFGRFLELTERALEFSANEDWLLCNRAFALHLTGQPIDQVVAAYRQALLATPDRKQWQKVAITDLEQHPDQRPARNVEWPPVAPDLIATVKEMGLTLPEGSA